jgi:MFS family permease
MTGVSSLSLISWCRRSLPGRQIRRPIPPEVQLTVSLYLLGLAVAQLVFRVAVRSLRTPPGSCFAGLALATVASTAAIFAASIASLIVARVGAIARRFNRTDHRSRASSATSTTTASTRPR